MRNLYLWLKCFLKCLFLNYNKAYILSKSLISTMHNNDKLLNSSRQTFIDSEINLNCDQKGIFYDKEYTSFYAPEGEIFNDQDPPSLSIKQFFKNKTEQFSKTKERSKKRTKEQLPYEKKKKSAFQFRYGNYHQYYGYRNQNEIDNRILCMKQEWFSGKDILDIGCNAGHFTLAIAKDFSPRCIVGIDIDNDLVKMAMRNIRHYIPPEVCDEDFPISFPINYGPVAQALDPRGRYPDGNFPFNVQFVQGNYILSSDESICDQEDYFDTVLCLSITKWIHLNWGDIGIKRLFKRIHKHLRPKGQLILEAQPYKSYAKKKKITEETFKHYKKIQLFPEMFNKYLIEEVGFETCELIDTPAHSSKGFSRPIYLFKKSGVVAEDGVKKPKHVIYYDSDNQCNDSDVEQLSD